MTGLPRESPGTSFGRRLAVVKRIDHISRILGTMDPRAQETAEVAAMELPPVPLDLIEYLKVLYAPRPVTQATSLDGAVRIITDTSIALGHHEVITHLEAIANHQKGTRT